MTVEILTILQVVFVVRTGEEFDNDTTTALSAIAADEAGEVGERAESFHSKSENVAEGL